MNDDAGLVAELGGPRSEAAARALYRNYGPELYGFAARRIGDSGRAEDVVQEVFTRAWRSADRYEPTRGTVRTWLYTIARNVLIDGERRRGRRPEVFDPEGISAHPDPSEPLETALQRHLIELALRRLTFEHRQVIDLVHFKGLSLAEVAQITGLALGTVKSRLYYAVANLRLALEELDVTP